MLRSTLLVLLIPASLASAGPIDVTVEFENAKGCDLLAGAPACPAAYDPGTSPGPGDDTIAIYSVIAKASVVASGAPVVGDQPRLVLDEHETYIEHPLFVAGEWLFVRVNDTLPPAVTAFASLHDGTNVNGDEGFWLRVHPYAIAPVGPAERTLGTGFFYGEDFYTRDRIRPLGTLADGGGYGSDDVLQVATDVSQLCLPETSAHAPLACEAYGATGPAVTRALQGALPNVVFNTGLRHASVQLAGSATTAGAGATGGAGLNPDDAASSRPGADAPSGAFDGGASAEGFGGRTRSEVVPDPASGAPSMTRALSTVPTVQGSSLGWLVVAGAAATALAVALYRRLKPGRLLNHPRRRAMYALVESNPGITVAALAARLGVDYKTAMHHADLLVEHGHFSVYLHGRERRLFASAARHTREDRHAMVALQKPCARRVLMALQDLGPLPKSDLAKRAGLSRTSAWRGVRLLVSHGLVAVDGPWKCAQVRLAGPDGGERP